MLSCPHAHGALGVTKSEDLRAWNALADGWSEWVHHNDNRTYVLDPAHLAQAGDVSGKQVLDAGCGEGRFARMLAERGAHVTALDFSPRMIEIAQGIEEKQPLGIDYLVADMTDLTRFAGESFDLVVAYLSVIDVPDYEPALREIARVMRPDASFQFSVVHPCFMPPGATWEPVKPGTIPVTNDNKKYKKIDGYFPSRELRFKMWPTAPVETINYHRTLTDYALDLRAAGLLIRDIKEPYPTEEVMAQRDYLREYYRAPAMMLIDCVKA
jgi:2-polyprenyl-3-methyl-5-hydroxy-6-metoxy-1,4-benzoquinol methylase